jgi:hypothetical protein
MPEDASMTTPTIPDYRAQVDPAYRELYDAIGDDHPDVRARLDVERKYGNEDPDRLAQIAHQTRAAMALRQGREDGTWLRAYQAATLPIPCPACGGPAAGRTRWDARCRACQDVALLVRAEAAASDVLPDGRTRRDAVIDYDAELAARATA